MMGERTWTALANVCRWLTARLDAAVERLHSAELRCLHRAWGIHDRRSLSERHRVTPLPQHYHHVHIAGDDWPPGTVQEGPTQR